MLNQSGIQVYYIRMKYRNFPKISDVAVSSLGLGMMRLPVIDGDSSKIDETKAEELFLEAVKGGVNYIDTAYPYHGGASEVFTGKVIEKHALRDSLLLATKCPVWLVKQESDWDRLLDEQLKRLRTDHIDFYLLHALNEERWDTIQTIKGLEYMEKAKKAGKIRHLGFSFHAPLESFKQIIDGYDGWEFCQIQLNYLDTEFQAGLEGMHYAARKNIGSIVMEPLRGGALAKTPKEVHDIFASGSIHGSDPENALRFVLDQKEVVTVLSGMGTSEQVRENMQIASIVDVAALTEDQKHTYARAANWYKSRMPVPCTGCGYCMPCPNNVNIPEVFSIYNNAVAFDDREGQSKWYKNAFVKNGSGADS